MKKKIVPFIVGLYIVVVGHGQVPVIFFGDDYVPELISTSPEYIPKETFIDGQFRVDSIYDMDSAYLIYVTKMDSSWFKVLGVSLGAGTQFTIISFKAPDNNKPDGSVIKVGEIYDFTMSPPDGIWIIFPHSDLWKYTTSARSPNGERFQIPLTLLKGQLMVSQELDALYHHSLKDSKDVNVSCFAQSNQCSHPPIQIGVGDTAKYICIDSLFKPNELFPTIALSYYSLNASISIINVRYYSNLCLFDAKIDTLYDAVPFGWINNNDSITICEWIDSTENNIEKIISMGKQLQMSLQSIRPINYVGHGESYVIVHNKKTNENVALPYSAINNNAMRIIYLKNQMQDGWE